MNIDSELISPVELRVLTVTALRHRGLSESEATQVFEHLLYAEASGKPAHGFSRLMRVVEYLDAEE